MQPPEGVPLQGWGYPNAGQLTSVVQCTSVTVQRETLKDHIIWSLFNFVYCNPCCLGLVALIQSIKARDRKVAGDIEGARSHAATARNLNAIATALCCLAVLICIIVFAIQIHNSLSYAGRYGYYY